MSSTNPFSALPTTSQASGAAAALPQSQTSTPSTQTKAKKRKGHRGGKKKRSRRKSFAVLDDDSRDEREQDLGDSFYQNAARNLSGASIDSATLLDHREQQQLRPRRSSTAPAPASPFQAGGFPSSSTSRLRSMQTIVSAGDLNEAGSETAPLLGESRPRGSQTGLSVSGYGTGDNRSNRARSATNKSSPTRLGTSSGQYDINNPPSVPGSPRFGAADRMEINFGDAMLRDELSLHSQVEDYDQISEAGDILRGGRPELGRRTIGAEKDVCFPGPGMSEMGDDEVQSIAHETRPHRPRRRRAPWPDLTALDEFSRLEKEDRTEVRRVKRVTEPQLVNGRLRPVRKGWSQAVEESPYRFTYFNEDLESTIHSQTISELIQPGGSFQELFIPDPPILSDDDSDVEELDPLLAPAKPRDSGSGLDGESKLNSRHASMAASREHVELRPEGTLSPEKDPHSNLSSKGDSGRVSPMGHKSPSGSIKPTQTTTTTAVETQEKVVRYGDRPVWWLDVLCPTEEEMRVLTKAFGIHPLTAEDILVQDPREKVELFRNYYFVNYRTFDQDIGSETFLDAVDMYVIVFREGVISFHFAMTPHAANVRRRIRQLQDYVFVSSDWISYALIDDITDAFQPLIKNIENEVDNIDDKILMLHSSAEKRLDESKPQDDDASLAAESSGDMLQRVGDCRKRVMNLYRLLGNKADVIKGFAKRCNERWEVAPRSDIGLYLGDIQDHIVTMTSNLNHYEGILARAHANYLAQINIRMNERQEQTADVLGKLTVLGTIVLPMNIITGLWGMNVWVPGQEYEGDLTWFWCITAGLLFFGLACFMIAKRVYNIV